MPPPKLKSLCFDKIRETLDYQWPKSKEEADEIFAWLQERMPPSLISEMKYIDNTKRRTHSNDDRFWSDFHYNRERYQHWKLYMELRCSYQSFCDGTWLPANKLCFDEDGRKALQLFAKNCDMDKINSVVGKFSEETLGQISSIFPRVERIQLEKEERSYGLDPRGGVFSKNNLLMVCEKLKDLKYIKLRVRNCKTWRIPDIAKPLLKSLNVDICHKTWRQDLTKFRDELTNLEELTIEIYNSSCEEEFLYNFEVLPSFRNLTKLVLLFPRDLIVSVAFSGLLINDLPNLKELQMIGQYMPNVTNDTFLDCFINKEIKLEFMYWKFYYLEKNLSWETINMARKMCNFRMLIRQVVHNFGDEISVYLD